MEEKEGLCGQREGRRKRQWKREQMRDEVHGHKIAKGGIFTTTRCAVVAEENSHC